MTLLTQQGLPTAILVASGLAVWRVGVAVWGAGASLFAWAEPRVDKLVEAGAGLARQVEATADALESMEQSAEQRHAELVKLAKDASRAAQQAANAAEAAAKVSKDVLAMVERANA